MRKIKKFLVALVVMVFILGGYSLKAQAASSEIWQQVSFDDTVVTLVAANPARPNEVAAVAGGRLELTRTGGVLWTHSSLPSTPRTIAYDGAEADTLYAGTDRGLFVSKNFGHSWQLLETQLTPLKPFIKVVATPQFIYGVSSGSVGSQNKLYRLDRYGKAVDTSFPDKNVNTVAYDFSSKRIYAGSSKGIYVSGDEGVNWKLLGAGMGQFTYEIVVKNTTIWQSSADGLFRSTDNGATWQRLAKIGEINNTMYGSDMNMRGLAVAEEKAYYGSYSNFFPYKFLVQYDGGAGHGIGLDQKVESLSAADKELWVATQDGLWINRQVVSSEAKILRPVVIIPGVLGSWPTPAAHAGMYKDAVGSLFTGQKYTTNLVLDPVQHTYDPLLENLEAKGYQMNKTLFTFPYQWRQDNNLTARQLADKIDDVQKVCGCPQVDLVGHSMGGLVARAYAQSDYYGNDVRNLIQIGTPNAGAVDSYAKWEAGNLNTQTIKEKFMASLFKIEAFHAGHITLVQYIRQKVLSVGQLLPVFSYIEGRTYPNGYPRNEFLEELNSAGKVQILNQRVSYYLAGSSAHPTLSMLKTEAVNPSNEYWPHGKVLSESRGDGDGTVLISSLSTLSGVSRYLTGDHGGMLGQADDFIAQTIMAGYVPPSQSQIQQFQKYLLVYVKSPVKISVIDAGGKRVDDLHLEIPHAYYSGSGEDTQMAIIPFSIDGKYIVELKGTANGDYGVGVVEFDVNTGQSHEVEEHSVAVVSKVYRYHYNTASDTFVREDNEAEQLSSKTSTPDINQTQPGTMPAQDVAAQSDNIDIVLAKHQDTLAVSGLSQGIPLLQSRSEAGAQKSNKPVVSMGLSAIIIITCTVILLMLWRQKYYQ